MASIPRFSIASVNDATCPSVLADSLHCGERYTARFRLDNKWQLVWLDGSNNAFVICPEMNAVCIIC